MDVGRPTIKRWLAFLAVVHLSTLHAQANEVCHFAGTTDYAGQLSVTSNVTTQAATGTTTVDVAANFTATPVPLIHIRYLMEEISIWNSDELQRLAVNSRYIVDGYVVRQEWDVFDRGTTGLEAYRVQGKTLDDFKHKHPAFVRHWDPAGFGRPWLQDYPAAGAERRRDLDLPAAPVQPGLRSPLALAFYWSRRLPRSGQTLLVFLPGFKKDKHLDVTIVAGPRRDGRQLWQTSVLYAALSETHPAIAKAWISTDGHLLQLAGSVQSGFYTGEGSIRETGCEGTAEPSRAPGG